MKQKRVGKYFIIGLTLAAFNYGLYTFIALVIINNNDFLWLSTLISTFFTALLAYALHSKITWKERPITKKGVRNFILYNIALTIAIGPFFTWLFTLITPLYQLAYNITIAIHLPFTYEFVESTGVFVLTSATTMFINFLFYDKIVFKNSKN